MNLRAIAAGIYFVLFLVTILNVAMLPSTLLQEVAPVLFTSLIMALLGMLLSLWIYQDGEKIEILAKAVAKLDGEPKELEKKE
jgi:hypothetical protein